MHLERVIEEMKKVFVEAPYGAAHTLRVLENAVILLDGEKIEGEQRETAMMAAALHDIGVLEAERKYGSMDGPYQEKEGAILARQILEKMEVDPAQVERICFLVGHHHTPTMIDGIDFRVLWEADLLENLAHGEKKNGQELESLIEVHFQTETGRQMAYKRLIEP